MYFNKKDSLKVSLFLNGRDDRLTVSETKLSVTGANATCHGSYEIRTVCMVPRCNCGRPTKYQKDLT